MAPIDAATPRTTPRELDDAAEGLGLAAAARLCPRTRRDRPVAPSTVARWITTGVRLRDGTRIRLAARRFPGGWVVTRVDLDQFVDRLTNDRTGEILSPTPSPARDRRLARVDAELDQIGI